MSKEKVIYININADENVFLHNINIDENYPYTLLVLMNKQLSYKRLLYLIPYITFNVDRNNSIIAVMSIEI